MLTFENNRISGDNVAEYKDAFTYYKCMYDKEQNNWYVPPYVISGR